MRAGLWPSVSVVVKMGVAGARPGDCLALGPGHAPVARIARNAVTATRVSTIARAMITAEVDLRDLSGSALVGYPLGWEVRTLSDRALRSRGVEPRYAFEVNDTRTLGLDGPRRGARSGTVEPRRPSAVDDAS